MRIAYFINQYPKVSHSFVRREILALERQGLEVERFALRGWDAELHDPADLAERERTRHVLAAGLKGLLRPTLQVLSTAPGRFAKALWLALRMGWRADRPWPYHVVYLAEACQLLQWLNAAGCQHVHAHFGTNSTEVVMLANALGGPGYSFTVHGPEEFDKPKFLHLDEKVRRATFVAAVSQYGRSQLLRWVAHEHWDKVKVVHCGLERGFHEAAAVPVADVPRLVCVGRLCEQKGQLLLLEAARQLAQRGQAFELVLAGDGELRGAIEALVARYGLQAQVRITGWISGAQVRQELLAARALVLPSFAEGLPVVIMEAMALRRPVLTTYVAGIPELVRPGENGWLFPAGSVEALVEALSACLSEPVETLQAMGEASYRRVLQRHDIDAEAARLAQHFRAAP